VEAELRRRIRAQGRITFAEFMQVALYLLDGGYYEAHAEIGRSGDFLTSPETHPLFGALLAQLCRLIWQALGAPERFWVIEYGAGTGSLCLQILEAAPRLDSGFAAALDYCIIEVSAFLRAFQQARLITLVDRVRWAHPDKPFAGEMGCVLANEVVDALPVHRLRVVEGELRELYTSLAGDRYLELVGRPSRPEVLCSLAEAHSRPPEGSVVEISLAAREWLRDAADRIETGYLVTMDFGGSAADLYAKATARGGLKCFRRHGWTDDPYDRPGLQDITTPVDFTQLVRVGASLGLEVVAEISQQELLQSLGFATAASSLPGQLRVEERERNLRGMGALVSPQGLGGYRALIQSKSAPRFALSAPERWEWVPLLPEEAPGWPE
jgi:SAM-dependent MidA family methyltransferase